jgi:uncharacterized repeat protein (TIGR03803 family)
VVFKLDLKGTETVLHSFSGADGANPIYENLIRDSLGNLYGTTFYGGTGQCYDGFGSGCGTIFEVNTAGVETVLYSFAGNQDGANPASGLVRDSTGNLYGTTAYGGSYSTGTVFELSPTGQESVLHTFTGETDGGGTFGGLLRDGGGSLYGTAFTGGDLSCFGGAGCGVVFGIKP